MSIYDEDWGEVRRPVAKSFVAPAPRVPDVHGLAPLAALPTNGEIDGGALRAMESGEKSTPVQRAQGAAIILVAFLAAGIIVGLVLGAAGAGDGVSFAAFLVCAVLGGALTYLQVTRYSPSGVELDKSARYENIRLAEIEANERLAMAKLKIYDRVLEKVYGND